MSGIHVVDERFGLRTVEWVEHGPFKLNGQRLLLKATSRHRGESGQDHFANCGGWADRWAGARRTSPSACRRSLGQKPPRLRTRTISPRNNVRSHIKW